MKTYYRVTVPTYLYEGGANPKKDVPTLKEARMWVTKTKQVIQLHNKKVNTDAEVKFIHLIHAEFGLGRADGYFMHPAVIDKITIKRIR